MIVKACIYVQDPRIYLYYYDNIYTFVCEGPSALAILPATSVVVSI